jgi:NO-binding membrane sensor protein with MHYT domain
LLGLVLATRAREASGLSRARWLALAAVSIGGTGIWLMHFMAMLGFDVPSMVIRYDVPLTILSVVIAVVIVGVGLLIVGMGRPKVWRVLVGGLCTGIGVAAMHYAGMAAMRMAGRMTFDHGIVALSVVIAVAAATVALWFALVIRGAGATVGAARLMAAAVCSMHYTGMAAVRVELSMDTAAVAGASPFALLMPISILACVVITGLAYATVGFSVHHENEREAELLDQARDVHRAAAMLRPGLARHR